MKKIKEIINGCETAENVLNSSFWFKHGSQASGINNSIKDEIYKEIDNVVNEKLRLVPNKMQMALRNLKNNVRDLQKIDKEKAPDGKCEFNLIPIFYDEDPKMLFESLKSLNNKSKVFFYDFLRRHYHIDDSVIDTLKNRYNQDFTVLSDLKKLIDDELAKITPGPTKLCWESISKTLKDIILKK